ncbi:nuclear transport factor 2 family protein [Streptoverticillium reticulum]|uniref:nuclear transport factor 2 family protein n=1 Tax=Streptoverticillium reticulum TaxID=1433415 RepID=UPI0039BFDBB9
MSSDVTEITQLVLHERQGRDRGWWDQERSCFAEDSHVHVSWFEGSGEDFVAGSQKMSGRGEAVVHRLSPPVVHVRGDRGLVELPALIEMRTVIDGVEADLAAAARLYYRVVRRDGRWLVLDLEGVYAHDTLTPTLPGTQLAIAPGDLAPLRPSYRFLAYVLSRRGYTIDPDFLGDDRPEEVARFYQDAHAWLNDG